MVRTFFTKEPPLRKENCNIKDQCPFEQPLRNANVSIDGNESLVKEIQGLLSQIMDWKLLDLGEQKVSIIPDSYLSHEKRLSKSLWIVEKGRIKKEKPK